MPKKEKQDRCPTCKQTIKKQKVCPHCGSKRVIMFTADDDICQDCDRWFPGT